MRVLQLVVPWSWCSSTVGLVTTVVELHGGPLDGWMVPVDLTDPWTAVVSDYGQHPGGRSLYAPDSSGRWVWVRDLRWDQL